MNKKFKLYLFPIFIIGLLTAIDQFTKFLITKNFKLYDSKPVIKDVFSITYIRNKGVAWGLFQGKRAVFLIITLIVLIFCFYIYAKLPEGKRYLPLRICIITLVSGALGNMIDRIKLGYVIDFFDFELINFPVFNVADIYVTLTMIALVILIFFVYTDEELEVIFK